ncbi:hypothetical protein [Halobaculum rubrum]|uniref:hypothetical protein n=1 Tax=Halobaculum rubrum TaxID=2872158 RepID=UPI001CA41988|nr:hypothetical protein [Halobaculum rubrum]QZY00522.1 hypothetical protein K6T25_05410 [Halobaculum rubrum]
MADVGTAPPDGKRQSMQNKDSKRNKTSVEVVRNKNSGDDGVTDVDQFVSEHSDFLGRVLARGDREARGHALALIANGGTVSDIDRIQQVLDDLKEQKEE